MPNLPEFKMMMMMMMMKMMMMMMMSPNYNTVKVRICIKFNALCHKFVGFHGDNSQGYSFLHFDTL